MQSGIFCLTPSMSTSIRNNVLLVSRQIRFLQLRVNRPFLPKARFSDHHLKTQWSEFNFLPIFRFVLMLILLILTWRMAESLDNFLWSARLQFFTTHIYFTFVLYPVYKRAPITHSDRCLCAILWKKPTQHSISLVTY